VAIGGEHGIGTIGDGKWFVEGRARIVNPTVKGTEVRPDAAHDGGLKVVEACEEFGEREGGRGVETLEFEAGGRECMGFDEGANLFSGVAWAIDDGFAIARFFASEMLEGQALTATCGQRGKDGG